MQSPIDWTPCPDLEWTPGKCQAHELDPCRKFRQGDRGGGPGGRHPVNRVTPCFWGWCRSTSSDHPVPITSKTKPSKGGAWAGMNSGDNWPQATALTNGLAKRLETQKGPNCGVERTFSRFGRNRPPRRLNDWPPQTLRPPATHTERPLLYRGQCQASRWSPPTAAALRFGSPATRGSRFSPRSASGRLMMG